MIRPLSKNGRVVIFILASIFLAAIFVYFDWSMFVSTPLPAFLPQSTSPAPEVTIEQIAETVNNAIVFLTSVLFGLFVVVGTSLRNGLDPEVKVSIIQLIFVGGFFFVSLLSCYFAYRSYLALLIQIENNALSVSRIESSLAAQAMCVSFSGLLGFLIAGLSLITHKDEN